MPTLTNRPPYHAYLHFHVAGGDHRLHSSAVDGRGRAFRAARNATGSALGRRSTAGGSHTASGNRPGKFAATSKHLREIDKANLALPENSAVGAYVTRSTIASLAKGPDDQFNKGVSALLCNNPHIDVDFSGLWAEQSAAVLDVLDRGETGPLREVRFRANLAPGTEALMRRIDRTITRLRDDSPDGKDAAFAFDGVGADARYAVTPDFRPWTNLTSVLLVRCEG